MTVKYMDGGYFGDNVGESLVLTYTHNANPTYTISSADWANALMTLTAPHGLTVGTKYDILVCPNYVGIEQPDRDHKSIPYEWTKVVGTVLAVVPTDATTFKIVKSSDGTTIIPVVLTTTENNNNVDITKFHFELPQSWTITGIPQLTKMRIKQYGYIRNSTGYRYGQLRIRNTDGTYNGFPGDPASWGYIQLLGIPPITNAASTNAIWSAQDWTIDVGNLQIVLDTNSLHYGRRGGYNSLVWDGGTEVSRRMIATGTSLNGKTIAGIVGIQIFGAAYAYQANGTTIQIYDLGGN